MKSTRKLFNSLLFTSALLGASVIFQRPAQASTVVSPVCPDPDDVTSLAGSESSSWYELTEDSNGDKGFCNQLWRYNPTPNKTIRAVSPRPFYADTTIVFTFNILIYNGFTIIIGVV